jgi:hypothetical protein
MGPIGGSETSVLNHVTPRNNPEDVKIQFHRGGSLRSRTRTTFAPLYQMCHWIMTCAFFHLIQPSFFELETACQTAPTFMFICILHSMSMTSKGLCQRHEGM